MSQYRTHKLNNYMPVRMHLDTLTKGVFPQSISNWHESIEILYCTNGKGHTLINSNRVEMDPGTITVINSNTIHTTIADTDILKYWCLIVDTKFLNSSGFDVSNTIFQRCICDEKVEGYYKELITELQEKEKFYEASLKGCVLSMMTYIFRKYSHEKKGKESADVAKLSVKYINEHFKEDITVESIAEHIGFSRFHVSRRFSATIGCSIREYIQLLRCHEAENMLRTKEYTVSEVASECGFSNVSYFTQTFKRVKGYLPSKLKHR